MLDYIKYGALFVCSLFFILRLIFFITYLISSDASELGLIVVAIALLNATVLTGMSVLIKKRA